MVAMLSPSLVLVSLLGMVLSGVRRGQVSCRAPRLTMPPRIDANWDKSPWSGTEPLLINRYVGEKPVHFPTTQFKVAYDDTALYVIFHVDDQYVRAVAVEHNDQVCRDSCVEFFFSPGRDVGRGYFNLEMNCGGTTLMYFQQQPGKDSIHIPANECEAIQIAHSLPKIVAPEIQEPVTWTVEYRLPLTIIERYCRMDRPSQGTVWRANFYKCGDLTSHPHWLSWAPVKVQPPDFHRPEFFGVLEFL
jgi:hypothetical protein